MSGRTTPANSAIAWITIVFSLAFIVLIARPSFAQSGTPPSQQSTNTSQRSTTSLPPTSSATATSATQSQELEWPAALQQYREVLETERKILEDQSKEYYTRVEKFAYLSLGTLVTALIGLIGFFGWMFGQTRKEVVGQIKSDLQSSVLSPARDEVERFRKENIEVVDQLKRELQGSVSVAREDLERFRRENIEALNSEYQKLKERLESLSTFGKQQVVWLLTENMPRPEGEISALHSVGLTRVTTVAPKIDSEDEIKEVLKRADLAIITFDGSPEAKALLHHASTALKFRQPPISLLIYTYGYYVNDRPVQLDRDDLKLLKDLSSFAPANFPATLVSQAQSLIIKTQSV